MTDSEILKAAIEKATKNGFVMDKHKHFCEIARDDLTGVIMGMGAWESIIFDRDFARCFFGTSPMMMGQIHEQGKQVQTWQEGDELWTWGGDFADFNLMKMVALSREARIKYLEKFL